MITLLCLPNPIPSAKTSTCLTQWLNIKGRQHWVFSSSAKKVKRGCRPFEVKNRANILNHIVFCHPTGKAPLEYFHFCPRYDPSISILEPFVPITILKYFLAFVKTPLIFFPQSYMVLLDISALVCVQSVTEPDKCNKDKM